MLVRGFLAGVILGYATSQAMVIQAQGLPPFVGAAAFPVGFAILTLLALELDTGNFALLPMGLIAGRVRVSGLLRNWGWVYLGDLIGGVFYATLFYLTVTKFGAADGGAIGEQIQLVAEKKTLAYADIGLRGWSTALVSGILANWMVTLAAVLAFASRSTIGKIAALWLPIMIFFAHGYEHSIVNMFAIPTGMFLGSPILTLPPKTGPVPTLAGTGSGPGKGGKVRGARTESRIIVYSTVDSNTSVPLSNSGLGGICH
jgi:formate/nitrite transporter